MYNDFPLILGADYSRGDADSTIQSIRNTIAQAVEVGFALKLFENEGLVLGSYHHDGEFNKSIIEVRSDGEVNLYGLLEFVFKDMMLFDMFAGKLLVNDRPKPLMTFDDFDRYFGIKYWVCENEFDVHVETGKLEFTSKETSEVISVIDAQYSNYNPPEIVDKFVEFVKDLYLESKEKHNMEKEELLHILAQSGHPQ